MIQSTIHPLTKLTERHDGVPLSVPDVDAVPGQVLHRVDQPRPRQPGDLRLEAGPGQPRGREVGETREHSHPGYLEQHSANLDTLDIIYFLGEGDMELRGECSAGGEAADGDGVRVDVESLQRRARADRVCACQYICRGKYIRVTLHCERERKQMKHTAK